MSREATDQLYIELGYFTPEEYYVYTAEAVAALSSEITFTCDAEVLGVVLEGEAVLEVIASLSADVVAIREFDSAIASEFNQTADAGKIVDATIEVGSLFSPAFDINAQLAGDALLEVISSLENTISKYTGFESTLENIVNLSLQGVMNLEGSSALSASFEGVTDAARFRDTEISLAASSSLSVDAVISIDGAALELSEFTLSADAEIVTVADAALSAEFNVAAIGEEFIPKVYPNSRPKELRFYSRSGTGTLTYYTYDDWVNSVYNNPNTSYTNSTYFNSASKYEGSYSFTIDDDSGGNTHGFESTLGSTLVIPSNTDFIFEFAIYASSRRNSETLASAGTTVAGIQTMGPPAVGGEHITIGTSAGGNLLAYVGNGITGHYSLSSATNLPTDTWSRVAVRRINGNTLQLVLNSTVIATVSNATNGISLGTRANLHNNPVDQTGEYISFDHWNLRIGESDLSDGSTIYDPANTYFRYRFENNFEDSLGGYLRLDAETLASTATITVTPNFTVDGITIHQSSGTLVADVGVIYEASASLSSEFTQAAEGEFVAIEASADLSAEFAQTADAYRIQEGAASLNAEFAQTTDGYRILEFAIQTDAIFSELAAVARVGAGFITAESYVNLTADVSKTVGFTADLLGVNTLSALVYKTVEGNASISSEASITADAVKTTDVDSTQNSEFTTATQGDRIRFGDSSIASEFTVAANVSGGFIGADAQLIVLATQDASGDRIRFGEAAIESSASISVIADRFAEMPAALSADFAQAIDYTRIRDAQISTDSLFSPAFDVNAQLAGVALLESTASLAATANVIQGQAAELLAQFNANIDAISYKAFDATLSSEAQIVAEGFVGLTGEALLASEFAVSCDGDVTGVTSSALISVASLITAVPEVLRSVDAQLTSSAAVTVSAQAIQETGAAVTSTASLDVELTLIVDSGAINLGALFTPNVSYRLLVLDQYVYTIPRETRNYTIRRETRSHSIERENRNYTIRG